MSIAFTRTPNGPVMDLMVLNSGYLGYIKG